MLTYQKISKSIYMASNDEITAIWRLMTTNYSYITKPQAGESVRDCEERLARLLDIWGQLLADIPVEVLHAASLQHISESDFFPTPHNFRDAAARIMCPRRQGAVEAWGEVVRAFSTYHNSTPEFTDPITTAVVNHLGWRNLCMSEMQAADRKNFVECWTTIANREKQDATMLPQVRDMILEIARAKRMEQLTEGER
jgi:hypothetical protein